MQLKCIGAKNESIKKIRKSFPNSESFHIMEGIHNFYFPYNFDVLFLFELSVTRASSIIQWISSISNGFRD